MRKRTRVVVIGLVLALLLAACESLPFDLSWLRNDAPTVTPAPGDIEVETPTSEVTITPAVTEEPVTSLTIWVPPEMDPSLETDASISFANRLQLFSEQNDDLEVVVRVKAASGTGGLLDALTATSSAAPDALPDLIVLSRQDLEMAALKSLIFPIEDLTDVPDDSDWYNFTREMALLQGETFGFPFAADSLALVYRTEKIPEIPDTLPGLLETKTVLAFPAENDQSLFTISLYLSIGGAIKDNQRRPTLEVEPLTDVFRLVQDGVQGGNFPDWLSQYQTSGQVWTAFREGQSDLAVTWVSNYLKEQPADAALVPLLAISDRAVSIGTGLSWAVAAPEENRQALAVQLAEFLVEPEFLSEWTLAAGYIPTRPSAFTDWGDQNLVTKINQIALMSQLQPSNDVIVSLGPILRDGMRQILQDAVDPAQAAQVAVESLEDR